MRGKVGEHSSDSPQSGETDGGGLPDYATLQSRKDAPPRSSWGLWGSDDQLGALNLLTPERVRRAATSVRLGQVVPLNARIDEFDPPLFGRPRTEHTVAHAFGDTVRDEVLDGFNTQASSQWDGFRHIRSREHGFYNGLPEERISISSWAEAGIAGRGYLVDLEGYFEHEGRTLAMDRPDPIEVDEVLGAVEHQGASVEIGDILILHTGWLDWYRRQPPIVHTKGSFAAPGLRPGLATLELLWDWHIATVAMDNPGVEVWPPAALISAEDKQEWKESGEDRPSAFMHNDLIARLGIPLGELWDTGALAQVCREQGRWDFLVTSTPMRLVGGVASPSNVQVIV